MPNASFSPSRYDANFVLKVSPLLWVAILWSVHHTLFLVMSSLAKSGYVFGVAREYAASVPMLASDIPGALVLIACFMRAPGAGSVPRWVWRHGAKFLIIGLSMSAAAAFNAYRWRIANPEGIAFWVVAISVGFIAYLASSRLVKAIFADFPQLPQPGKDNNSSQTS